MKYAYYGFGMLLFGSIGLILIVMMQSITINNDSEYYNLKEAMKAAMLESVDYECYRSNVKSKGCGYTLKISEQKFVENFTRRFAATVGGDATGYYLDFYDIIESPPKASVIIRGKTNNYGIVSENESITITNGLSGILELKNAIGEKYGYHSAIPSVETELTPENDLGDVTEAPSSGEEGADIEADDEGCEGKTGDVASGCGASEDGDQGVVYDDVAEPADNNAVEDSNVN